MVTPTINNEFPTINRGTTATKPIPFVREFPIIGSIPQFLGDRLDFSLRLVQELGDVHGFHLGPVPVIVFNQPEYVHSILVEHASDFDKGRVMHKAFTGNGLFISEGEFHRKQRKLMAPSFQPRLIANYADTMASYGEQLQQTWSDGEVIDLNQTMISVTMSIIGKVLFDADVFTETDELGRAMATIFENVTHTLTSLFVPPLSWPTPRNRRTQKAAQVLTERIQQMIDERRHADCHPERSEGSVSMSTEMLRCAQHDSSDAKELIHAPQAPLRAPCLGDRYPTRNDFLSILLRAKDEDGSGMSDQQLMDECLTLFGAGHETTAATLTWAWYLLCQHPALYEKVQQEVDSVLQGRTPTYADLASLPYCLQVFKETMRLYPPATGVMREALHDVEIDGYRVPKGTNAVVPIYTLHRIPRYFPEPETFDPDRFLPEREQELPRYAYLPFGAGPRICIGNYFAMMEGQLLIATLAQRATFLPVPNQVIAPDLTKTLALRPYGKVEAVVKRRV